MYGFNAQYSGVFDHVQDDLKEVVDIADPERATYTERRRQRLALEDEKFDPGYYQ